MVDFLVGLRFVICYDELRYETSIRSGQRVLHYFWQPVSRTSTHCYVVVS